MFRILYLSAARRPFSKIELLALLEKSRQNNARLGITGILLYRDGDFLQLLEGEESAVRSLYHRISADPRHGSVRTLVEDTCEQRLFEDWSMAFRDLADPTLKQLPGFSALLNQPRDLADHPDDAMQIVLYFSAAGRR
jgi:hypothetical protein